MKFKLQALGAAALLALTCSLPALPGDQAVRGFDGPGGRLSGSGPAGFEEQMLKTVGQIKDLSRDDDLVLVRGRLTGHLKKNKYVFTGEDGGTITVELDDDRDWSFIARDQPIEILAKVDRELLNVELEVRDARALEPQN